MILAQEKAARKAFSEAAEFVAEASLDNQELVTLSSDNNSFPTKASGYHRFGIGLVKSQQNNFPALLFDLAVAKELLGDRRERGIGANSEYVLLNSVSEIFLRPQKPWQMRNKESEKKIPVVQFNNYHVTILRYRNIENDPTNYKDDIFGLRGWGLNLYTEGSLIKEFSNQTVFSAGPLVPLWRNEHVSRHFIFGANLAIASRFWERSLKVDGGYSLETLFREQLVSNTLAMRSRILLDNFSLLEKKRNFRLYETLKIQLEIEYLFRLGDTHLLAQPFFQSHTIARRLADKDYRTYGLLIEMML